MLDHHNICWTVDSLREALGFAPDGSRIVSYLPMAHIAERMTTHYAGIAFALRGDDVSPTSGSSVRRSRRPRPQILFGVPRTFEKIHSTVQAVLAADPDRAEVFARGARDRRARRRAPRLAARRSRSSSRPSTSRSTPSRCDRRASCSGSTTCASRSRRRRRSRSRCSSSSAARACRCRSSTACRSRPGR